MPEIINFLLKNLMITSGIFLLTLAVRGFSMREVRISSISPEMVSLKMEYEFSSMFGCP